MSAKERTIRIVLSVLLISYGLLILNHSFYSFWIAGGPPNKYPDAWYQQGIISGWRAIALIVIGFFCQFRWQKLKSSIFSWFVFIVVILGFVYPYAREQWLIDTCLDSGGKWSSEYFNCEKNA